VKIETDDAIIEASEKPKVTELIQDYRRCSPWDGTSWNRLTSNEETRYAVWPGQTPDGKKNDDVLGALGKKAFPFNGASDTRIMLADEIINESVALLYVSFMRAAAAQKMSLDVEQGYALKLLDYFLHDVMSDTLHEQVELSGQYRGTYGLYFLHPRWVREVSLERETVKLDQLLLMLQALGAKGAQGFPNPEQFMAVLKDPAQEKEALAILAAIYDLFAKQQMSSYGMEIDLPPLSKKTLRKALEDLRDEGEALVPMPYICRNEPEVLCLKPWDEVTISGSIADLKKARVYRRIYMDEVSLRRKIVEEGWKEEWVAEALKHKGKVSNWGAFRTGNGSAVPTYDPGRFNDTTFTMYDAKNDLIEVVYATYWALDEDNVPGVQCTVFHPEVGSNPAGEELYAEHGLLELGKIPYVAGRREITLPQITASRGVPEVVVGWQREKKVNRDGAIDLLSIAVLPPINTYADAMGAKYRFGPGVTNTVKPGREPKFMQVEKTGVPLSHEMADRIDRDADRYFQRMSEHVAPVMSQVMQQKEATSFLLTWTAAFQMVLELAKINMPDAEFAQVTGAPEGWLEQHRSQRGLFKAALHFDIRELDPEFVQKQLELINAQVLPGDSGGVVNRGLLTKMQLHAINPVLARELIQDEGTATQKMFDEVKQEVAMMFLGNVPKLVENDPAAGQKLQWLQQIVQSNPNYMEALKNPDGRFMKLMMMFEKNLKFSVQQEQNKQIGRIGVNPEQVEDVK
jgi:hypothetical protein